MQKGETAEIIRFNYAIFLGAEIIFLLVELPKPALQEDECQNNRVGLGQAAL